MFSLSAHCSHGLALRGYNSCKSLSVAKCPNVAMVLSVTCEDRSQSTFFWCPRNFKRSRNEQLQIQDELCRVFFLGLTQKRVRKNLNQRTRSELERLNPSEETKMKIRNGVKGGGTKKPRQMVQVHISLMQTSVLFTSQRL